MSQPVRVFISWAHTYPERPEWQAEVFAFAQLLSHFGTGRLDVRIDLLEQHQQAANWSTYGPLEIAQADYVLLIASPAYRQAWDGIDSPTRGAEREANTLKGIFDIDREAFYRKLKLVLMPGVPLSALPLDLVPTVTRFKLCELSRRGLDDVLRLLLDDPKWSLSAMNFEHSDPARTEPERAGSLRVPPTPATTDAALRTAIDSVESAAARRGVALAEQIIEHAEPPLPLEDGSPPDGGGNTMIWRALAAVAIVIAVVVLAIKSRYDHRPAARLHPDSSATLTTATPTPPRTHHAKPRLNRFEQVLAKLARTDASYDCDQLRPLPAGALGRVRCARPGVHLTIVRLTSADATKRYADDQAFGKPFLNASVRGCFPPGGQLADSYGEGQRTTTWRPTTSTRASSGCGRRPPEHCLSGPTRAAAALSRSRHRDQPCAASSRDSPSESHWVPRRWRQGIAAGDSAVRPSGREAQLAHEIDILTRAHG